MERGGEKETSGNGDHAMGLREEERSGGDEEAEQRGRRRAGLGFGGRRELRREEGDEAAGRGEWRPSPRHGSGWLLYAICKMTKMPSTGASNLQAVAEHYP